MRCAVAGVAIVVAGGLRAATDVVSELAEIHAPWISATGLRMLDRYSWQNWVRMPVVMALAMAEHDGRAEGAYSMPRTSDPSAGPGTMMAQAPGAAPAAREACDESEAMAEFRLASFSPSDRAEQVRVIVVASGAACESGRGSGGDWSVQIRGPRIHSIRSGEPQTPGRRVRVWHVLPPLPKPPEVEDVSA